MTYGGEETWRRKGGLGNTFLGRNERERGNNGR
jgi:hypothetical protein